ncbi:MAG: DUF3426 domain-containing protein, partial [Rhodospirillaceae bacterium]|nr:DUF3426 domain-containing protein [Rhodospirillaceae bacterium]
MQITCPTCKTAFSVDGVMIDAVGRPVRCFNCQHIWHQYPVAAQPPPQQYAAPPPQYAAPPPPPPPPPPEPEPEPIPEPEPVPMAEPEPIPEEELPSDEDLDHMLGPEEEIESVDVFAGGTDDITDIDEEALESIPDPEPLGDIHSIEDDDEEDFDEDFDPDDIPDPDPIPNVLSEGVGDDEDDAPKKSLIKRLIMPLIIIVVIAGIGAGLVVVRGTVVGLWPGANGAFYDWIGMHVDIPGEGLAIKTAAPARETRDGKDAVVVKGTITNIADTDRPVPVIQIIAFDGNGQPVQTESMSPEKSLLKPGEKFDFSAVIIDLVPTARRLDVTFGDLESEAPKDGAPKDGAPK